MEGSAQEDEPAAKRARTATSPAEVSTVPRPRLASVATLSEAVAALRAAKRVMVVVGAGVSVACGVPDFRSENGLYSMVEKLGLALDDPQDLFSIDAFDDDPAPFYSFAHALWPGDSIKPSFCHHFLVALARQKKLLRVYSQNIDGLERSAGLPASLLVECHGSLATARCRGCGRTCSATDLAPQVSRRVVPRCNKCDGVWKPQVTFFGEPLPKCVGKKLEADRNRADLLLVIGTSLQVAPVSKVMGWLPPSLPQILINREPVAPPRSTSDGFDVSLIGDADVVVAHLAEAAEIPIRLPEPVSAAATRAQARDPDAVCMRGAVWGPQATEGDAMASSAFVSAALVQLTEDAEDEELVETVSCDGCERMLHPEEEIWTCDSCFGYDLCGDCHAGSRSREHAMTHGKDHSFKRER